VEIGNFIVRVGNLRWTYEYFDPYTGKPARSECPWLSFEWEARRKTADEGSVHPLFLTGTGPATLEIRLYLGISRFRGPDVLAESETWDPDPDTERGGRGGVSMPLSHPRAPGVGSPVAGDPGQPWSRRAAAPHPDHALGSHRAG
jgi:hypothetical protein